MYSTNIVLLLFVISAVYPMKIQYCYDVEYIFGIWNSSMEDFIDIGAHQYFEQADFFMPELLLK